MSQSPPNSAVETNGGALQTVDPATLKQWLDEGAVRLVDVREPVEHAQARIAGSQLRPLTAFDASQVLTAGEEPDQRGVVFYCRTGRRSGDAAQRYLQAANGTARPAVYNLVGGIEAWKKAGLATERLPGAPRLEIMRQVQMAAGSLVVLGTVLGAFVNVWFLLLSGFVGAGLVFAGASGFCGMARLLAKMPWNRSSGTSCCSSSAAPSDDTTASASQQEHLQPTA